MDTPLEYFFNGNIAHNSCEVVEDHHPPDTSFLLWGGFFPPPTKNKKCSSSFVYVFTEDFRGPLTLVERTCLNDGQHLDNFSVGHNWEGHCRGSTTQEFVRVSRFERPVGIIVAS